MLLVAHKNVN